ncbi:MAG: Trk system potassium transporter TrkA [Lachnospiraceae bacterium]|nr:Trk system potassium transporter TrkA [Lachnospiraceae bacterium]
MNIIIAGCGNIGRTLAEQLNAEGHDITVIDNRQSAVETVTAADEALGVVGNITSLSVLEDAGVRSADILIAVTGNDELNLLACLMARKSGCKSTIARVENPDYNGRQIGFMKEELGLSMVVNPHRAAARETGRLLKYPSALRVESFAKSRVEIITFKLDAKSILCGLSLKDMAVKLKCDVLISLVTRGEEVIIPGGDFVLQEKDEISVVGAEEKMVHFLKILKLPTASARDIMIAGGGRMAQYLAQEMLGMGVAVKLIERDDERCRSLSELLPRATIIHGDATEKNLLLEEGLIDTNAFISATDFDEENIMLSLYAKSVSKARCITRIHRVSYENLLDKLEVGSTIYPKNITAEHIIKYVRAMKNSLGSNIETLYRLHDNKVEALEFLIREYSAVTEKPLSELKLKNGVLVVCVTRKGQFSLARGNTRIDIGDTVIVMTTNSGITDIKDILR